MAVPWTVLALWTRFFHAIVIVFARMAINHVLVPNRVQGNFTTGCDIFDTVTTPIRFTRTITRGIPSIKGLVIHGNCSGRITWTIICTCNIWNTDRTGRIGCIKMNHECVRRPICRNGQISCRSLHNCIVGYRIAGPSRKCISCLCWGGQCYWCLFNIVFTWVHNIVCCTVHIGICNIIHINIPLCIQCSINCELIIRRQHTICTNYQIATGFRVIIPLERISGACRNINRGNRCTKIRQRPSNGIFLIYIRIAIIVIQSYCVNMWNTQFFWLWVRRICVVKILVIPRKTRPIGRCH